MRLKRRYKRNSKIGTVSEAVTETEENNSGRQRKNVVRRFSRVMEEIKVGKILIVNSTTFLVFTLPHTVDLTLWMSFNDQHDGISRFSTCYKDSINVDYNTFLNLLWTCNYALNFYFYCVINQDIRTVSAEFINRFRKLSAKRCSTNL